MTSRGHPDNPHDSPASLAYPTPPSQRSQPWPSPDPDAISPVTLDDVPFPRGAPNAPRSDGSAHDSNGGRAARHNDDRGGEMTAAAVDAKPPAAPANGGQSNGSVKNGQQDRARTPPLGAPEAPPQPRPAARHGQPPHTSNARRMETDALSNIKYRDSNTLDGDGIVEDMAERDAGRCRAGGGKAAPVVAVTAVSGTEPARARRHPTAHDHDGTDSGDYTVVGGGGYSGDDAHSRRSRRDVARMDEEEEGEEGQDGEELVEHTSCMPLRRWMKQRDPLLSAVFKWAMAALLLCFLSFIVFGILYSGIAYHGDKYTYCEAEGFSGADSGAPNVEQGRCGTPYGTILGGHEGVFGYSNCNSDFISDDDSYTPLITLPSEMPSMGGQVVAVKTNMYTGLQWQCVEYARRYWMLRGQPEPAFFGSVDGANDIWQETVVWTVYNQSKTLPLRRYPNGASVLAGSTAPEVGDLIIYSKDAANDFPFGHVAVIVGVNRTDVFVAEQNWFSTPWPAPFRNYSRTIRRKYDPVTLSHSLDDPDGDILGWMRYG